MNPVKKAFNQWQMVSARPEWLRLFKSELYTYIKTRPASGRFELMDKIWIRRPVAIVIMAAMVLMLASGAVAAENSLPTDWFYPVKIVGEQMALTFTPTVAAKTKVRLAVARQRLKEARAMVEFGDSLAVAEVINNYEDHIKKINIKIPELEKSDDIMVVNQIYSQLDNNQEFITELLKESYIKALDQGNKTKLEITSSALSALDSTAEVSFQDIRPRVKIESSRVPQVATGIKNKQTKTEQKIQILENRLLANGWTDESHSIATEYLQRAKANLLSVDDEFKDLTSEEATNSDLYRSNFNHLLQAYQLTIKAEDVLLREKPRGLEGGSQNDQDQNKNNRGRNSRDVQDD